jgi:hypothetical protein
MTASGRPANELFDLLCDLVEDRLTPEEAAKLQDSLSADPANQRQYLDFMVIVSGLRWSRSGKNIAKFAAGEPSSPAMSAPEPSLAPSTSFLVRQTTAFSSLPGNVVLSYVAVALLLGVGILAVRSWETGGKKSSSPSAAVSAGRRGSAPQPTTIIVGTITGTSNCRWTDPRTAVEPGAYVPLGRTFALNSGRLEIAYLIGTKVDLEGPAVYCVDSDNGGYLKQGKSIFHIRLPKLRGILNENGPLPKFPPFVIHTPHGKTSDTFLVTDMDLVLAVEASGVVWGQAPGDVAWNIFTPGRPLQKVVLPESHILFGVNEKGAVIFSASDPSQPAPTMAHQPPKGAPIYSGEPKGANRKRPPGKAEGREVPNS